MHATGTAGRLLDDGSRLLPFNVDPDTGEARMTKLKNTAGKVPLTQLR